MKRVGHWIAGFTSRTLNRDAVGNERLVYLMQVAEKLPFEKYHTDARYAAKIPVLRSEHCIETVGDNIYGKRDGVIFQIPNRSHQIDAMSKDTGGRFALIGTLFAYFGSAPLVIPDDLRPVIPPGISPHGVETEDPARAEAFVRFVLEHGTGIHARPTSWRSGDNSWQRHRSCR